MVAIMQHKQADKKHRHPYGGLQRGQYDADGRDHETGQTDRRIAGRPLADFRNDAERIIHARRLCVGTHGLV